jgi:hypothetical protein
MKANREEMKANREEMQANREDAQMRNQLMMMQMQQQAQQQQQFLSALMQIAGGNVGAKPAALASKWRTCLQACHKCLYCTSQGMQRVLVLHDSCFHCAHAGPTFSARTEPIPESTAPGSSGLNDPPKAAAHPRVVVVDQPMPTSSGVPVQAHVTATTCSVPAPAAAAVLGAATTVANAGSVHVKSASKEGEAVSIPKFRADAAVSFKADAAVSLPDEEVAQRTRRSSKPNRKYVIDA